MGRPESRRRRLLAAVLLEFLAHPLALEARQVIDEQFAVEVVDLVLDAYREQTVGLHLEGLAVAIERPDADAFGAGDLVVVAGHGQAALLHGLLVPDARRSPD